MARTTTTTIEVDGQTFTVARLTIGALRAADERLEAAKGEERVDVMIDVIRSVIARADPATTVTAQQLADLLDGEDLGRVYREVMAFAGMQERPSGEAKSP